MNNKFTGEELVNLSLDNLGRAEGGPPDYALLYASLAIGQALLALTQEVHELKLELRVSLSERIEP